MEFYDDSGGKLMFGYVKAFRPRLLVCELDLYKSVYCGLCKTISGRYGAVSSLTLSYDFVFLTVMKLGADKAGLKIEKRRCPLHPVRKTPCAFCTETVSQGGFEYGADCSVILTYHKLKDDLSDKGLKEKFLASLLIPFYAYPYRKASEIHPYLSQKAKEAMRLQRKLERSGSSSIDRAAEPTAAIMSAVFSELGGLDPDLRYDFSRFGYFLGKYVYICDALDDLQSDYKRGGYNPLISKSMMKKRRTSDTPDAGDVLDAARYAKTSVFLTLGALAQSYAKLPIGDLKPIADNVIYLGLKNNFMEIYKGIRTSVSQKAQHLP